MASQPIPLLHCLKTSAVDCVRASTIRSQQSRERMRSIDESLKRVNPRPWRHQYGESSIHGLLECESVQCISDCGGQSRKWNRDLLAVSNFRRIWEAYMNNRE
jgi:hypothetical protein